MKITPLIQILQQTLPKFTDKFSDNISISSGNITSGTVTIVTNNPHNLTTNEYITISNAFIGVNITSFVVENNIATVETIADHGLSMSMNYKTRNSELSVDIKNNTNSDINGNFTLLHVPNRKKFTIAIDIADGNYTNNDGIIINYAYNAVDGVHQVAVINDTSFSYTISNIDISSDIYGDSFLSSKFRISGANDILRANSSYTRQNTNKYWLFVTYGSSTTSKDRNILNDSTASMNIQSEFRLRLVEDFDINIFVPVDNDLTGITARDNIEDIKLALFKSIIRLPQVKQFANDDDYQYIYINDFQVEANDSYIIHGYKFGTIYDITLEDTAEYGNFTPFRDIDISIKINDNVLSNNINLDEDTI